MSDRRLSQAVRAGVSGRSSPAGVAPWRRSLRNAAAAVAAAAAAAASLGSPP